MENELKQRNGCISFFLWVAIIVNIAMVIKNAAEMFDAHSSENALVGGLCSIFGVVNVLGAILLLRWNKIGFYMMVVSSIMAVVVTTCVLKMGAMVTIGAVIGSLISIAIWRAILQVTKNGVSAWSLLQSGWDGKHCRHLYQLFAAIGAVLFFLTMIAFSNAGADDYDYLDDDIVVDEDDEVMPEIEVVDLDAYVEDSVANVDFDTFSVVEYDPVVTIPEENEYEEPTSSDSEDYDKHVRFLKELIKETNKNYPQKTAEGMVVKRCYLDGDYVMYLAECDEDLYDMELFEMNIDEMKQGIRDMLRQNSDPQISYFVKLCINAHKGLGYKYQGDTSGKACSVTIPYSELIDL